MSAIKMTSELIYNRLPEANEAVDRALGLVLDKGAADIAGSTVRNIVENGLVDTGAMKASVDWSAPDTDTRKVVVAQEYAIVHEYGGHGNPARPFLGPAFQEHKDAIRANVGPAIKSALG